MTAEKILEALRLGEIEELKKALEDEIYIKSRKAMKKGSLVGKRYEAMEHYFKYSNINESPVCRFPSRLVINGTEYSSFMDRFSIVLTTESTGAIELYNEEKAGQPYYSADTISKLFKETSMEPPEKINMCKFFAEARILGYKFRKSFNIGDVRFLLEYKGDYYDVRFIEKAFDIINDGADLVTVRAKSDENSPMTLYSDIGKCLILPLQRGSVKSNEKGYKILKLQCEENISE